jgi:hypothetical protein
MNHPREAVDRPPQRGTAADTLGLPIVGYLYASMPARMTR